MNVNPINGHLLMNVFEKPNSRSLVKLNEMFSNNLLCADRLLS